MIAVLRVPQDGIKLAGRRVVFGEEGVVGLFVSRARDYFIGRRQATWLYVCDAGHSAPDLPLSNSPSLRTVRDKVTWLPVFWPGERTWVYM